MSRENALLLTLASEERAKTFTKRGLSGANRLERSGMRWSEQMAEAIVQLRAIYLSGDFDQYWQFHIDQDQKRLYPAAWSVVLKVWIGSISACSSLLG